MSLPPGFLDELRTRVSLSAIVGRKVTWDMRKSNMAKGDWWAPCPFHQEKSASFHVDDRKGFYYCFGCHAKGDVLSFLQQSENLSFMEAVSVLAGEAGMQVPERDPRAAEKADRRSQIIEVIEETVKFYRLQLKTQAAAHAREYLSQKRRLGEAAIERWEIGWAPEARGILHQSLAAKGFSQDLILASGMVARTDSGELYDRFRGRIIFPIRDARGRAISLGGRSLDPNARAKYLNGPETEVFDKGRNLFNLGPAREAAGKGQPLLVAEGYMDVIALSEAGFRAAVAPLGTAVTEDQLRLLWRVTDEPIIALDGDSAGIRAALRVIDLALPLLHVGKGLRFALLPEGQDPDDLIKARGPAAMQEVLDAAQPMVRLIWQRATEGKVFDSPERRAALEHALKETIQRITDPVIRSHYNEAVRELLFEAFRQRKAGAPRKDWTPRPRAGGARAGGFAGGFASGFGGAFGGRGFGPPPPPLPSTRKSALASGAVAEDLLREAVILAGLVARPHLVPRFEPALERLDLSTEDHARLRNLLLTHAGEADCRERIRNDSPDALDRLLANPHVRINPALQPHTEEEIAAACIEEALARLQADRAHRAELAEAVSDVEGLVDEGLTWRVFKATEARASAGRGPKEQKTDSIIAPNGVELDRHELDRARTVLDSIDFSRGKRDKGGSGG